MDSIDQLFTVTDGQGKKVKINKLLSIPERVFLKNYKRYYKDLLPLSMYYLRTHNPGEVVPFVHGIILGIILEKRKLKVNFDNELLHIDFSIIDKIINRIPFKL
jgi:hypothetical protein